jgi:MFS family permease
LLKNPLADLPREVNVLVGAGFFVAVGFGIIVPAMPVFARSFGVSHAAIGLILSAFAITRFASGLIAGKLVDIFGERSIFAVGVFIVSFTVLMAGLAQNYSQLLFFRAAGGFGSSMFTVAASSVILSSVSDDKRAHAQSVYNGAFLLGAIAGPAIGGALATISLRAPFFTYSLTLFIAGTIGFFFLTSAHLQARNENEGSLEVTRIRDALSIKAYRYVLVISFVSTWILLGLRSSILPLFVTEKLGSSAAVVGYGFTLSAIFQGILILRAGRVSDDRGRRFALVLGSSLVLVGLFVMIFTVHVWMYLLSMSIIGLGGAFLSTTPASIVGDVIKGKGGQVIALFQMAADAGMMVGPIIVGFIADHFGYRSSFTFSTLVFTLGLILAIKLPETRRSHLG